MEKFSFKNNLLEFILSSEKLKVYLTFNEQLKLYHKINSLDEMSVIKILEDVTPPKTNPMAERILKMGLITASFAIPLPGLTLALMYLVDVNRFKCMQRVEKSNEEDKILSMAKCRLDAAKWGRNFVRNQMTGCGSAKDPEKCQRKLGKMFERQNKKVKKQEKKFLWARTKSRRRADLRREKERMSDAA
jgi:hypothetical protein